MTIDLIAMVWSAHPSDTETATRPSVRPRLSVFVERWGTGVVVAVFVSSVHVRRNAYAPFKFRTIGARTPKGADELEIVVD
jgi:hypothetical protein